MADNYAENKNSMNMIKTLHFGDYISGGRTITSCERTPRFT